MAKAASFQVDADYKGVIREAKKAEEANKKTAKAAGDIGKKAARAGRQTKHAASEAGGMGREFGRTLMKIELIQQALSGASAAIREMINAAAGASQTQRERRADAETALIGLGVDRDVTGLARRIEGAEGVATQQQRVQFLQALEGTGRRFSTQEIAQLAEAFAAGGRRLFGEGGRALIQNLRPGLSVDAALGRTVEQRRGAIPALRGFGAAAERDINRERFLTERTLADRGTSAEIGRLRAERLKATSPLARTFVAPIDALSGGIATETLAAQQSRNPDLAENTAAIRDLSAALNRRRRPQVGAQGEDGR